MLLFNMCEGPKKIWHHFGLFLSLFSAFHLKFLQLCKKPQSYICGTHQLLFPMVNNAQNWCQKLWRIFSPLLILQGECDHSYKSKKISRYGDALCAQWSQCVCSTAWLEGVMWAVSHPLVPSEPPPPTSVPLLATSLASLHSNQPPALSCLCNTHNIWWWGSLTCCSRWISSNFLKINKMNTNLDKI